MSDIPPGWAELVAAPLGPTAEAERSLALLPWLFDRSGAPGAARAGRTGPGEP